MLIPLKYKATITWGVGGNPLTITINDNPICKTYQKISNFQEKNGKIIIIIIAKNGSWKPRKFSSSRMTK